MVIPQQRRRIFNPSTADFSRRRDGGAIGYSGTRDEQRNRDHYSTLMEIAHNAGVNMTNGSALVLASGAGYGAFYLRESGFMGKIRGEEIDPNSVGVANFIASYFGHEGVKKAFAEGGASAAKDLALSLYQQGVERKADPGIDFTERDITRMTTVEPVADIIVCDFIHQPDFIGAVGVDNVTLRLWDSSRPGTVLSYRCGSEKDRLDGMKFKEVAPVIFVRK